MKIVGLITEYNPFHNGHLHHINMAKKITDADFVVVIMSGDFVQRGVPAIIDKYSRTQMALSCGADLVIELPSVYATASAEFFAYGAVSILDKLGCIDYLCFGSEYGELGILQTLAKILVNEPDEFKYSLKKYLKEGYSFPIARTKALLEFSFDDTLSKTELENILSEPNNILAIEYIKAVVKLNSSMRPVTIKRIVSGYHDTSIHDNICSASAIRAALQSGGLETFKNQVPESVYEILSNAYKQTFPVYINDFSSMLKYRLLLRNSKPLSSYLDVSDALSNTIMNQLSSFKNIEDFANLIKSKQYTLTRINRALIHILLNIENDSVNESALYIRILGFKKDSSSLLTIIKEHASIPVISKLADSKNLLSPSAMHILSQDIFAADIYNTIVTDKFDCHIPNEFRQNIIII